MELKAFGRSRTRLRQELRRGMSVVVGMALLCLLAAMLSAPANAAESLCATVKIEISQELTLERQAFDAHMKINNGVANMALTEVNVDVEFADAAGNTVLASFDPDATNALFFIQIDSMSNISDVDGAGTVAASTSADIHWRIIPAQGAGGSNSIGTLYYVGATLSYKLGGEAQEMTVSPDYIYVKPMPDLVLDYFLAGEVYGDDAWTEPVEPPVPFSLGVRVRNIGCGTAKGLQLDTGQPRITANVNGLLVGFLIQSCELMGLPQTQSLLVDFGDVAANGASLARWIMTSTLSGTFTNFTASFSHADELGGQLTSLIQPGNVRTHLLVHDVLVDSTGSDAVRDFLATDGKVYESNGTDTSVTNVSSLAQLVLAEGVYTLSVSQPTTGFMYVKLANPAATNMVLKEVVRSDGKRIKADNAWLSRSRKANPEEGWDDFLNLFDANASNCTYAVSYETAGAVNRAPELSYIGAKAGYAGEFVSFEVEAADPDGATPALSSGTLPAGASFTDNGDGVGSFTWTPATNQMGEYRIKFTAFDGALADSETITLAVASTWQGAWPSWWETRGVLSINATTTNDFAAINQGQVKHIAQMAGQQLKAVYGTNVTFTPSFSNMNNYAVVNIGQLKALAKPYYDVLISQGYTNAYPWAGASATNDYGIANIGQVKKLFGFDPQP